MKTVVIGAGIVGACTAIELLRDGHEVVILEPATPGGEQAASYGNGAWLSPHSVVPMSMPGLWRKVPGMLMDPLGPLTIRWTALPRLLPWLLRFIWAGATVAKVQATSQALGKLLADSPGRHLQLATEAGVPELIQRTGLLHVFPNRTAFEAEALAWRLRRDAGVPWIELDANELRQREPSLSDRYTFGVLVETAGHCRDPGFYVAALVRHAVALGATRVTARATGFVINDQRLHAVATTTGPIACERAVIAAGIHSKALARQAGDRVSLESERGYHVQIADPEVAPRTPIMPSDGKMANTRTNGGLRAAGQVELASVDAEPNWARADVLLANLLQSFPGLPRNLPKERVARWLGHRPSTPDGLPVIDHARLSPDIIYAFGHGHIGLAGAPATGRIAADLVSGRVPAIPIKSFRAARFA